MTTNVRSLETLVGQFHWTAKSSRPAKDDSHHVVAILPRGEAIRNFIYTGALDEVANRAKVSLLSIVPGNEFVEVLRASAHDVYELKEIEEKWPVEVLREILDLSHGRWLWSEAARERWRLRDMEAVTPGQRVKRFARKAACYPFANRRGLRFLSRCERASSRWLRTTEEYVQLFKTIRPSLVFNGSHVHSRVAMQAVQAARWLEIPTAAFIFSWDNLTSQGRIMPPYDYYIVWNDMLRDQLLSIYDTVRPSQVFVTGTPQFDFHFRREFYWSREEFCAHVGADPSRPIVLYTTGMSNHMPGEPLIVERIGEMLRKMTVLGPPQLVVRVYPKDHTARFDQIKERNPDILFPPIPWEPLWLTPRPEDAPLLTNMLRHAAVGVNVASTVSLELAMFDKPVINVGYNPPGISSEELDYARYYQFEHYRRVVESGAVTIARSQEEMESMLRRALMSPEEGSHARREFIKSMFGDTLDGYSNLRVADRLIKLATLGTAGEALGSRAKLGLT